MLEARLTELFRSRERAYWLEVFADTDDCVWPVLTMSEAPQHPHNRARDSFVEVAGIVQPAPAPKLSRTPGQVQGEPPLQGEHSRAQLLALGLSAAEVDGLAAAGVIRCAG